MNQAQRFYSGQLWVNYAFNQEQEIGRWRIQNKNIHAEGRTWRKIKSDNSMWYAEKYKYGLI